MLPALPIQASRIALGLGLLWAVPVLSAQEPQIILRENQVVPNLGTVQSVSRIAVSDQGTVFTRATIQGSVPAGVQHIMRGAFPTFIAGLPIPEPGSPGNYSVRSNGVFSSFELDERSNLAWRLQTTNVGTGTGLPGNHTGIYYNLSLIHNDLDSAHTLSSIESPFFGILPGLNAFGYSSFNGVDQSTDGMLLLNCELDSNGIASGGNAARALILTEIDALGQVQKETLLALGSTNGAPTFLAADCVSKAQNSYQVARNGHWVATMRYATGALVGGQIVSAANDWAVVADSPLGIVAREGMTIPGIGTLDSGGLSGARTSINSFGQVAYIAGFSNGDDHLIADGQLIAAEGASALNLPSLAPNSVSDLQSSGQPPVRISDSGDVFWYARISGPNSTNRAFMRNQDVLIRKGVSTVNGILIRELDTNDRGYDVSKNGRFWAGLVTFAGGGDDAVILIDLGLVAPIPGTGSNPSSFTKLTGDARIGEHLLLSMDGSQGPGSLPMALFSLQASIPGSPIGVPIKAGELFIDLTPGIFLTTLTGSPVSSGASGIGVDIPLDPSLVDLDVFAQGAFFDQGASNGGAVFHLTNGLHLIVGAS